MEMMHPVILVKSSNERTKSGCVLSAYSFVLVVALKLPNVMFILKKKTELLKVLYFPFGSEGFIPFALWLVLMLFAHRLDSSINWG